MTEAVCRSRSQGRGRVVHLGAILTLLGLLVLLLLSARAARHARGRLGGLMDYEARVALFAVPLESS